MARILHIDGDSFFASVEISLRPGLRGKPVVTGEERGIATAMSKEAKTLGVHRGMPVFKIRKEYPEVIVLASDYHHYRIFTQRMYNIVRHYTDTVEEYSIDECFGDFSDTTGPIEPIMHELKRELTEKLGMTFSIGVGPSKVLAKIASKWNKPDGLTILEAADIHKFLKDMPVGKVWGIGPNTARALQAENINTALELVLRPKDWIEARFARPVVEIYTELKGESVLAVHDSLQTADPQASLEHTRTFTPPTMDKKVLINELSTNIEAACRKARAHKLSSRHISFFLKTQEFRYKRTEIGLVNPLSTPADILKEILNVFDRIYAPHTLYRATGVRLGGLVEDTAVQTDLFGGSNRSEAWSEVFKAADRIDQRFGTNTISLGSSLRSIKGQNQSKSSKIKKASNPDKRKGFKKRFQIPFMGEVR